MDRTNFNINVTTTLQPQQLAQLLNILQINDNRVQQQQEPQLLQQLLQPQQQQQIRLPAVPELQRDRSRSPIPPLNQERLEDYRRHGPIPLWTLRPGRGGPRRNRGPRDFHDRDQGPRQPRQFFVDDHFENGGFGQIRRPSPVPSNHSSVERYSNVTLQNLAIENREQFRQQSLRQRQHPIGMSQEDFRFFGPRNRNSSEASPSIASTSSNGGSRAQRRDREPGGASTSRSNANFRAGPSTARCGMSHDQN